jgi:SAM-dependent methyltransferase
VIPIDRWLMRMQWGMILIFLAGLAASLWAMRSADASSRVMLALVSCLWIFLACNSAACISGAPFIPSSQAAVERMLDLAGARPGMTVYDLGCGSGRILAAAARRGARAVGWEANPFLAAWSSLRAVLPPLRGKVRVRWGSLWDADLSDADAVLVYLMPYRMGKLADLLKARAKPGTVLVSNSFDIEGWKPEKTDSKLGLYVYRV